MATEHLDKKPMEKVAVVGAGAWGKNLVRNFHELGALTAICETAAGQRQAMKEQYPEVSLTSNLGEILQNPNITSVAIATPAETHGDLIEQSLHADKHVFVEKPLCLSVKRGKNLAELAKDRGKVLMVGHLLWYHPTVLKLKELVDEGELGRISYIYSNRLNLGKIRREENILWSFAPHDISVILGLLGETPSEVKASGGAYLHENIADVTVSTMAFPSGVRAHVFVSWLHPYKEQKLVVVGDRKMAVFDDTEPERKLVLYPHSIEWRNQIPVAVKAEAEVVEVPLDEPLKAECQHFLECVRDGTRPRTDASEALRVLEVLERCQESLENLPPQRKKSEPTSDHDWLAHESAVIDEDVEVGTGTKIWHFTHVMKGSRIGRDCRVGQNILIGPRVTIGNNVKIQNNVSVYEGVTLEDDVFCGPSMVFTNVHNPRSEIRRMDEIRPTLVRQGASFGANCTILCGLTIGQFAFIGAGSVVLKDVPDYGLVVGNPGRLSGWMCRCGVRLEFREDTAHCICGNEYRLKDGFANPVSESRQKEAGS